MKNNPDDRRDNVDRIQRNISNTLRNCELADEIIAKTDDEETKSDLIEKNERREDALHGMRKEIQDEAIDKRNGYNESSKR
ncbi:MAG: small acid-soluble spore protein Tlp [Clostridiaceae bacterium]|nr:small acid-soluble spore protein Tlp [Clostridiaceae bacterium]